MGFSPCHLCVSRKCGNYENKHKDMCLWFIFFYQLYLKRPSISFRSNLIKLKRWTLALQNKQKSKSNWFFEILTKICGYLLDLIRPYLTHFKIKPVWLLWITINLHYIHRFNCPHKCMTSWTLKQNKFLTKNYKFRTYAQFHLVVNNHFVSYILLMRFVFPI